MTPEEFAAGIKRVAFDYANEGSLQPHGQQPREELVRIWDWYIALSSHDQALVRHAMRIAVHSALFGFFAVLGGEVAIDDPPQGELRLIYVDRHGNEQQLNRPEVEELQSLWIDEVYPYTEPTQRR